MNGIAILGLNVSNEIDLEHIDVTAPALATDQLHLVHHHECQISRWQSDVNLAIRDFLRLQRAIETSFQIEKERPPRSLRLSEAAVA